MQRSGRGDSGVASGQRHGALVDFRHAHGVGRWQMQRKVHPCRPEGRIQRIDGQPAGRRLSFQMQFGRNPGALGHIFDDRRCKQMDMGIDDHGVFRYVTTFFPKALDIRVFGYKINALEI